MKITDKSLNLDVQGQGCWSDCYFGGQWRCKTSTKTKSCYYVPPCYCEYQNIFS